jgi:hypothetical protein
MSEPSASDVVLNQRDAFARAEAIEDVGRKQFVLRFLTAALIRVSRGDRPASSLDMTFLVGCASDLYDQRAALTKIFAGEDLRWWPDDE